MKSGLQRIEATLNQLHAQSVDPRSQPPSRDAIGQLVLTSQTPASETLPSLKTYSFDVRSLTRSTSTVNETLASEISNPPLKVQPFPVKDHCPQAPNLPKLKRPSFSSHRHAANPGFAMGLLKDMQTIVGGWQAELQQILMEIQELYLEGPIVDGWLESENSEERSPATAPLRHADPDRLMGYVQAIGSHTSHTALTATHDSPRKGYRLCGLDADGQLWSRPCPPDQLAHVSLAIARYQKLRQLLARKQELESRLSQLAQDLIEVHSKLQ
ncbi:MAG: hypothetical protein SFY66_13465 [Oculatellaceae cyanobacterium bins.114]|nr:hypothetical protein [Oculatellaceae cyanobacterium bins.114]